MLVAKYHDSNCKDKEILVSISKAIKSSLELRSKKELIEQFIEKMNADTKVDMDWVAYVRKQKDVDLKLIIEEERLKPDATYRFMAYAFRDGLLRTSGTEFDQILPPVSRFGGGREKVKERVSEHLKEYFDKYFGLVTSDMSFGGIATEKEADIEYGVVVERNTD